MKKISSNNKINSDFLYKIINEARLEENLFSTLELTDNDLKLFKKLIKKIDSYASILQYNLSKDFINFNYLSELNNISQTKFEIALEIRNYA